jgi:hypothetical protein
MQAFLVQPIVPLTQKQLLQSFLKRWPSAYCRPLKSQLLPYEIAINVQRLSIVDIHKDRGDNPLQDSPVKESSIRLFS